MFHSILRAKVPEILEAAAIFPVRRILNIAVVPLDGIDASPTAKKPINGLGQLSFRRGCGRSECLGSRGNELSIKLLFQFCQTAVGDLLASGSKRLSQAVSVMEAVNVKWALASVQPHIAPAGPEILAGPEVPAVHVQLPLIHGVDDTSKIMKSVN
jgi:hypothetical protein